jgi:glucose-6-phosphate-specific signal transduction histidine kinase
MQERVSQVGGALMVQSNGNGTSVLVELPIAEEAVTKDLARIIRDFIGTKGLAMVQIRCLRGFETKSEAFA